MDPPAELPTAEVTGQAQPSTSVGGWTGITPMTPTDVIGQQTLLLPGRLRLSDVLDQESVIGQSYAVTGYYENFTVHGFTLDLGSDYRIDGFLVPGEMDIAIENKESISLIKGSSAMVPGTTSAFGSINFTTKSPQNIQAAQIQFNQWGGREESIDLGVATTVDHPIGWRINAAGEVFAPGIPGADGHRNFMSLSLEAHPLHGLVLGLDLEAQNKAQRAVPGLQLLGGTVFPSSTVSEVNINQQPWSRPVINDSTFLGIRAQYDLSQGTVVRAGVGEGMARISDNLAFPDGCDTAPYQYFCANGDYLLYDYHASELRETRQSNVSVELPNTLGPVSATTSIGLESVTRTITQTGLYSTLSAEPDGSPALGSIYTTVPLPAPPIEPTSNTFTSQSQNTLSILDELSWFDWRAIAGARWSSVQQDPGSDVTRILPELGLEYLGVQTVNLHVARTTSMSFGSVAPIAAENAGALLVPRSVIQDDVGVRWKIDGDTSVGADAYWIARPFEFTQPSGSSFAGLGNYIQKGREVHRVLDLTGETTWARLRFTGNISLVNAVAHGTGFSEFDGVQEQNVPDWRASVWAHYLPNGTQADVAIGVIGAGRRNASSEAPNSAPAYSRVDGMLNWPISSGNREEVFALGIVNAFDRRYWRDVGFAYGADLLFPAPRRTFTASLRVAWR